MQRVGIPVSSNIGGDVFESFTKINDIIRKNDGVRSFSIKTNSCFDADAPVPEKTQTRLRITNNYHDINQIGESYIRCKWKVAVSNAKKITANAVKLAAGCKGWTANDPLTGMVDGQGAPMRLFVGWKNASEAFRQLEVENNNVDCDYLQTEMSKESCAYSAYMPDEEKRSKRYAHSTWEEVEKGIPGQAGVYIDIPATVNAGGDLGTHEFETVIPITDLLAFQAFEEFPGCLGDIVLKWYFTSESMVYAFVDPINVLENERFWDTSATEHDLEKWMDKTLLTSNRPAYTRGFTQVGQQSMAPTTCKFGYSAGSNGAQDAAIGAYEKTNYVIGPQTINITSLSLEACYCDVYGYNVTQECKRNLAALFTPEHPMIIPSQHVDVKNMPKHNSEGMYDADFTYALHNVTDFIVVWPRSNRDLTCFYNPRLKDLQLKVDGKLYPTHKLENTWDYRFYQMMMNASDLDNYYEADKSYSQSLTAPIPNAWNNTACPYDISTFLCTFQAERNTAGYCFDGLETGNLNVNIGLQYTNSGSWYKTESIAPQIWFTRDTYWTCDNVNGLKYHKVGTPPQYASSED